MSNKTPFEVTVGSDEGARALNRQAIRLLMRGDAAGALEGFRRCTELAPDFPEAWNNSGLVHMGLAQYDRAITDFDRALVVRPDYPEACTNRGRAREKRGDLTGAGADFERALECCEGPFVASILHNRGALRQRLGDLAGARADFDRALEIDPDHTSTYVLRAELHKLVGNLAGARADLDRALESVTDHHRATVFHKRGGVRVLQNDFVGAVADYDECLALEPENSIFYISRGNARYHLRDVRAIIDYRMAFRLDAELTSRELARTIAEGARADVADTLENCRKHLRIDPRDAVALVRRALTLLLLGQDAEAEIALEQARAMRSDMRAYLDRLVEQVRELAKGSGHAG
jgi:tetratricopeptide (TPR) repeat protein